MKLRFRWRKKSPVFIDSEKPLPPEIKAQVLDRIQRANMLLMGGEPREGLKELNEAITIWDIARKKMRQEADDGTDAGHH